MISLGLIFSTAQAGPFEQLTDEQLMQYISQDFYFWPMPDRKGFCILPNNTEKFSKYYENGNPAYQCLVFPEYAHSSPKLPTFPKDQTGDSI